MPSRVPATIRDRLTFYHSMPSGDEPLDPNQVRVTSNTQNERDRTAVGLQVIIDHDDKNILYGITALPAETKRLAGTGPLPAQKVTRLTVICDTLTIRCRWWMPECEVIIYARRIEFVGDGCLDTSPAPWQLPRARDAYDKTPGENGAEGRPGGKVTVYVSDVDAPAGSRAKRIITDGGRGQDAGLGRDGEKGYSPSNTLSYLPDDYVDKRSMTDSWMTTKVEVKLTHHKGKTILGIQRKWMKAWVERDGGLSGTTEKPTDGEHAIRPGDSGSGGAPGLLATNYAGLIALWRAEPGKAGEAAPRAKGGDAGSPRQGVFYRCTYVWKLGFDQDSSNDAKVEWDDHYTGNGNSYSGRPGNDADRVSIDLTETEANLWLHSALVPMLREYVRTCYLRNDTAEAQRLVDAYAPVFLGEIPLKRGVWQRADTPYWRGLQAEFGTLQQRLASHVDFFGNPAGYTPMLSLASSFQLYRMELDLTLEVLLFTAWVAAKQNQQTEAAEAARAASQLIIKESAKIAENIQSAELRAQKLNKDIVDLKSAQDALLNKLGVEKTRLYKEAAGDLSRISQIKMAVNLGAALCQVIPVGQPILGGAAAAGADAFDLLDEEPDEVLKKVKARVTDTVKAYKDSTKETSDIVDKAKKEATELATAAGKKLTVDEIKKLAKSKPTPWATAGKGFGEAAALAGKAYKAASVTQSDIEVQIAKLAAKDPTWKAISKEIKALIEQRASVYAALVEISQQVGQGYADLAGNYDALAALNGEEASARARALTGNTFRIIEGIRDRALLSVTESLYNVVRAFESVLFTKVDVIWSLGSLITQINDLLSEKPMSNWTDTDVKKRVESLKTTFKTNLDTFRAGMLKNLAKLVMDDRNVDFEINADREGAVLDALNRGFSAEIDTMRLNVIEPDWEHQMLSELFLEKIEFAAEPKVPTRGDVEISVEISQLGVVRDGDTLFGLRLAVPLRKTYRYHFEGGKLDPPETSEFSQDLMRIILGDEGDKIRRKLAMPSAWSVMTLSAHFNLQNDDRAPKIARLKFKMKISSLRSKPGIVLHAFSSDGSSPIMMNGDPYVEIYRVNRNAATVELSVDPSPPNGPKFRQWHIRQAGEPKIVKEPKLKIDLDTHARVEAQFERV